MASALTVLLLGCWLAGQCGVSGQLPAPRPSISVSPSGVITWRGAITIRCQCRCAARRLFLYKDGIEIQELDAAGDGGEFTIPSAKWADGGVYMCQSCSRSEPPIWSDPSDFVRIIVVELSYPKPSISLHPSAGVGPGGAVTIQCWSQHHNMRFLLYKDGNLNVLQDVEPAGDVAEFPIRNVSHRDAGSYRCYYHHKWHQFSWSHPSDSVELVVAGGTDPTQLGTVLVPTHPGSVEPGTGAGGRKSPSTTPETAGSEPSAAPGLTCTVIAGVSAAAAGLLLLLVAFLCCRRTQERKGPAPRQSRESEAAATVYALVGERKQLDVLEPDPSAKGLTYAELDGQALLAKRGGPAPAPEPVLYAAINVSRGPHRQSPQGASTHPHSVNPAGVIAATGQGASATTG